MPLHYFCIFILNCVVCNRDAGQQTEDTCSCSLACNCSSPKQTTQYTLNAVCCTITILSCFVSNQPCFRNISLHKPPEKIFLIARKKTKRNHFLLSPPATFAINNHRTIGWVWVCRNWRGRVTLAYVIHRVIACDTRSLPIQTSLRHSFW